MLLSRLFAFYAAIGLRLTVRGSLTVIVCGKVQYGDPLSLALHGDE